MTADTYVIGPLQKVERRDFDDRDVRAILDACGMDRLVDMIGQPHIVERYTPTRGNWSPGRPLPALRSEDPAVAQAHGRCAVARMQGKSGLPVRPAIHDRQRCGWCEYPLPELLAACDWAVFRAAFLESELFVWHERHDERRGSRYMRAGRSNVYTNPTWAQFWALSEGDRQQRIRAAQYPEEASR